MSSDIQIEHWIVCADHAEFEAYKLENQHQKCRYLDSINELQAVRPGKVVFLESFEDSLIYHVHGDIVDMIEVRWKESFKDELEDGEEEDIKYGV